MNYKVADSKKGMMCMDNLPMTREEAVALLKSMPQLDSDMNHYLETEAIMRSLAERFGENADYWGMLGLLHDIDWSLTKNDWKEHCVKAAGMLKSKGFDDAFIENVQSHGYGHDEIPLLKDKKRASRIQHCLIAAETLTGIVYAYALMRGKRISDMDAKGLSKKFNDKKFAANCSRELVREIELAGLATEDFFALSIEAIKGIKEQIGLE
jgi:putative nucleotidyltransferase with HDIG domain